MFKGCKKIYTPVLQSTKDYPEDISYRGKGLSNEYRLSHPSGLTGNNKATSYTRVFEVSQKEILLKHTR